MTGLPQHKIFNDEMMIRGEIRDLNHLNNRTIIATVSYSLVSSQC